MMLKIYFERMNFELYKEREAYGVSTDPAPYIRTRVSSYEFGLKV